MVSIKIRVRYIQRRMRSETLRGGDLMAPPPRGRPPYEDGGIFGFTEEEAILAGGCPRGGGGAPGSVPMEVGTCEKPGEQLRETSRGAADGGTLICCLAIERVGDHHEGCWWGARSIP